MPMPSACSNRPIDSGPRLDGFADSDLAIVVFAHVDDLLCHRRLPHHAVSRLCNWGVRLVCVSRATADFVRQLQHELNIQEPFICNSGAALHVPNTYFRTADSPHTTIGSVTWEVFKFSPPDRAAAVNLVCDLFLAAGWDDVLTIGVGCDADDYSLLTTVDIPVVVRDAVKDQTSLLRHVPGAYLTDATGSEGWSEALSGP
jgi:predicted mannosyl-3-phosphoglycerate phosphatase (HAD superfamily)